MSVSVESIGGLGWGLNGGTTAFMHAVDHRRWYSYASGRAEQIVALTQQRVTH